MYVINYANTNKPEVNMILTLINKLIEQIYSHYS